MVPYSNYKRIPAEEMLFWNSQWHWNTHGYQSACLTNWSDLLGEQRRLGHQTDAYSESQSICTTVSSEGNRATVDARSQLPMCAEEPFCFYSFNRWRHHFSDLVSKEIMYKVCVQISRYIYTQRSILHLLTKRKIHFKFKNKKNLKTIVLDKVCKVLCSASMRTYAYKTTGGPSDMCL